MAFPCAQSSCPDIHLSSNSRLLSSCPLSDVSFHSRRAEPEMLLSQAHHKRQCVRVPVQPVFRSTKFLRSFGGRKQPIAIRDAQSLLTGNQPTEQERIEFRDLAA